MSWPLRSLASPDKNSSKIDTGSRIEVILYAFTFLFTCINNDRRYFSNKTVVLFHLRLFLGLREGVNFFNKL